MRNREQDRLDMIRTIRSIDPRVSPVTQRKIIFMIQEEWDLQYNRQQLTGIISLLATTRELEWLGGTDKRTERETGIKQP